jgi:DNA modification methylase
VGIVAVEKNRRFIGIEVDKAACHLARARVGGYKVTDVTEKTI